jgi:hypothetical protein
LQECEDTRKWSFIHDDAILFLPEGSRITGWSVLLMFDSMRINLTTSNVTKAAFLHLLLFVARVAD